MCLYNATWVEVLPYELAARMVESRDDIPIDGWRGLLIRGLLEESRQAGLMVVPDALSEHGIGCHVHRMSDCSLILVEAENLERAIDVLASYGYDIIREQVQ